VAIYLVQSGEDDAEVEHAKVLTMRGTKGQTLPADTVRVVTQPLPRLEGGEAESL